MGVVNCTASVCQFCGEDASADAEWSSGGRWPAGGEGGECPAIPPDHTASLHQPQQCAVRPGVTAAVPYSSTHTHAHCILCSLCSRDGSWQGTASKQYISALATSTCCTHSCSLQQHEAHSLALLAPKCF